MQLKDEQIKDLRVLIAEKDRTIRLLEESRNKSGNNDDDTDYKKLYLDLKVDYEREFKAKQDFENKYNGFLEKWDELSNNYTGLSLKHQNDIDEINKFTRLLNEEKDKNRKLQNEINLLKKNSANNDSNNSDSDDDDDNYDQQSIKGNKNSSNKNNRRQTGANKINSRKRKQMESDSSDNSDSDEESDSSSSSNNDDSDYLQPPNKRQKIITEENKSTRRSTRRSASKNKDSTSSKSKTKSSSTPKLSKKATAIVQKLIESHNGIEIKYNGADISELITNPTERYPKSKWVRCKASTMMRYLIYTGLPIPQDRKRDKNTNIHCTVSSLMKYLSLSIISITSIRDYIDKEGFPGITDIKCALTDDEIKMYDRLPKFQWDKSINKVNPINFKTITVKVKSKNDKNQEETINTDNMEIDNNNNHNKQHPKSKNDDNNDDVDDDIDHDMKDNDDGSKQKKSNNNSNNQSDNKSTDNIDKRKDDEKEKGENDDEKDDNDDINENDDKENDGKEQNNENNTDVVASEQPTNPKDL